MRVRIQLANPEHPTGSDRRRMLVLLRALRAGGHDADPYTPGDAFDVLVIAQTPAYRAWLPVLEGARRRGNVVIHDVTNDVHAGAGSFAASSRHGRLAALRSGAMQGRWRLQQALRIGNWGAAPRFWRGCSAVVAGSTIQADKYRPFTRRVFALVDPVDPDEYRGRAEHRRGAPVVLAWEGTRDNLVYLLPHADVLRTLRRRGIARLRVVTDRFRSVPYRGIVDNVALLRRWGLEAEFVEWRLEDFSRHLAAADIGIAPLPSADPFSEAKPANKILGYAFLRLPVVASPIRAYQEAIAAGGFGFLAREPGEWEEHVGALADTPALRRELGERGHAYVAATSMPDAFVRRYLDIIARCLDGGRA